MVITSSELLDLFKMHQNTCSLPLLIFYHFYYISPSIILNSSLNNNHLFFNCTWKQYSGTPPIKNFDIHEDIVVIKIWFDLWLSYLDFENLPNSHTSMLDNQDSEIYSEEIYDDPDDPTYQPMESQNTPESSGSGVVDPESESQKSQVSF